MEEIIGKKSIERTIITMGFLSMIGAAFAKAATFIAGIAGKIWGGIKTVGAAIGSFASGAGAKVVAAAKSINSVGSAVKAVATVGSVIAVGACAVHTAKDIIAHWTGKSKKLPENTTMPSYISHRSVDKEYARQNPELEDIYTTAVEKSAKVLAANVSDRELEDPPKKNASFREKKKWAKKLYADLEQFVKDGAKKVKNAWDRRAQALDDFGFFDDYDIEKREEISKMCARDRLLLTGISLGC